jgi:hypothetical protein
MVRAYASAWYSHLSGEAGKLRITIAKEAALNALRSAQLAESERALAQTNMANILKDKQVWYRAPLIEPFNHLLARTDNLNIQL